MSGAEIREKINANNILIAEALTPNIFTLNNRVSKLLEENRNLQETCEHEFQKGFCIYCDKAQE